MEDAKKGMLDWSRERERRRGLLSLGMARRVSRRVRKRRVRKRTFQKMLVTEELRDRWEPSTDAGETDAVRWRRWLEERGCDSDGYDDCQVRVYVNEGARVTADFFFPFQDGDGRPCVCRSRQSLKRDGPTLDWQFSAASCLTLPSAARNFVYAHSGMLTVVYQRPSTLRNLLKACMVGAKTVVYRKWFSASSRLGSLPDDLDAPHPVFLGAEGEWGRRQVCSNCHYCTRV